MVKRMFLLCLILMAAALSGCGDSNSFESVSDDGSREACEYQVRLDLDAANYRAVVLSTCAHPMDKAAAHMGQAGFSVDKIVSAMLDANKSGDSGAKLGVYLKTLVTDVSQYKIDNLNSARNYYNMISPDSLYYKDALFNNYVLAGTVITMSNLKGVLDFGGDGLITDACDRNGNGKADEIDALACALGTCSLMNATGGTSLSSLVRQSDSKNFTGYTGFTYTPNNTNPSVPATCPLTYNKLKSGTTLVAASSDVCVGSDSLQYNCPIESALGVPVDLVSNFSQTLADAQGTLTTLLAGSSTTTSASDVNKAITELRTNACGVDGICTSAELAAYLASMK